MASTGAIHTFLITTTAGNVIVSRHYDTPSSTDEQRERAEQRIHELTHDVWPTLRNESFRAASYDEDGAGGANSPRVIVFTLSNDVLLFLVGSGEYDEIVLTEVLQGIVQILRHVCCRDGVTEASILKDYKDVLLCIDEIICKGIVHLTDAELVHSSLAMELEKARR